MDLEGYNFHWREGFNYGFPKKRESYDTLVKSLSKKRITIITGTRRTGKTTLMKQLMDWLIKNGTARSSILYYSFDEEQPQIRDIVNEYEKKIFHGFSLHHVICVSHDLSGHGSGKR